MIVRKPILPVLLLMMLMIPVSSMAFSISAGFVVPNFQTFPIGDFVDMEVVEDPDADIDFGAMAEFFYLSLTRDPGDTLDTPIMIHLNLRLSGEELLDYESPPTTIRDWTQGADSRTYYNNEFEDAPWFQEDDDPYYADAETFIQLIEAGNLRAAVFFLTFEVYRLDESGFPLAMPEDMVTLITQVYNPTNPELIEPDEGMELDGTPILFRWNWNGGPMIPADWTLIIVEGPLNADGESVISSRNEGNTRYEGSPQTIESHMYMGMAGEEDALQEGSTYYWQTRGTVYSVLGTPTVYSSNIYSFTLADAGRGDGDPGGGPPDDDGGMDDEWGGGPFGGGPDDGDDDGLDGGIPDPDGGFGGGIPGGPGVDEPGGVDDNRGQPEGGQQPDQDVNATMNILANILDADQLEDLMAQFEGYDLGGISIDGIGGLTLTQLDSLLNEPGFEFISITIEE